MFFKNLCKVVYFVKLDVKCNTQHFFILEVLFIYLFFSNLFDAGRVYRNQKAVICTLS